MQSERLRCITPETLQMLHNMLYAWDTSHFTKRKTRFEMEFKQYTLNVKKQSKNTKAKRVRTVGAAPSSLPHTFTTAGDSCTCCPDLRTSGSAQDPAREEETQYQWKL